MPSEAELIGEVVKCLSDLMAMYQQRVRSESRYPRASADESDDVITEGKKRVTVLRRLRQEFEDEMNGV